jgi:hypothetical protein
MTKTAKLAAKILACMIFLGIVGMIGASSASAATPSKTHTVTTWNSAHTVKTTVSHTVRATGTTDTNTVTKYAPKAKGKSQVKLSAIRVSESKSTHKDGSMGDKITTTTTVYNSDGSVKSEDKEINTIS